MIKRFKKITDNLYRGSAPSVKDVIKLHKLFGIKNIISLDAVAGNKIKRICKLLNIDQKIIPINGSLFSIMNLLHNDIKKLLTGNGPTFIHCQQGKDRTGFLTALFKCKYMGWGVDDALNEAKSLGFGVGVDPRLTNRLENILRKVCENGDDNNADIVSKVREYISDGRSSALNEADRGSFSPYLTKTRQYPFDSDTVYNYVYNQEPTRQNVHNILEMPKEKERDTIPLVGLYDNTSGIKGVGPVEIGGGFLNV